MAEELRYFQWLAGENKGQIHIFDHVEEDEGNIYVCFKDKSRMNEQYIVPLNNIDATGKMMAEISHPDNAWKFETKYVGRQEERWEKNADGELVCVEPLVEGRKIVQLIPPRKVAPKVSNFGNVISSTPTPPPSPAAVSDNVTLQSNLDSNDPVYILMAKSKKFDTEIQMDITIALPNKSLYKIAEESFENGGEKFIEYIIQNITVKEIKDAIKIALTNMYQDPPQEDGFYNG